MAATLLLLCWVPEARADTSQAGGTGPTPSPRLLGDPGGLRTTLEQRGLELRLFYNQFLSWKPEGGRESHDRRGHSGSYDWITLVDGERLAGWPGLTGLLHVKGQYDRNVNEQVGALSDPIDDADFDEAIYVDQLWLEQTIWRGRLRLIAGFLEMQTFFDRNLLADSEDRQFVSTHLDNNGVLPLPNGLGTVLLWLPGRGVELALGLVDADNVPTEAGFDTAFDGIESLNAYAELSLSVELDIGGVKRPGQYRIGGFVDGRRRAVFGRSDPQTGTPRTERGHLGAYLSFDQRLTLEGGERDQGLGAFVRAGIADEDVSPVVGFWSAGLEYRGLLPGRDADVLGVAAYHDILSDRFEDASEEATADELGLELYYRIELLPSFHLSPDVQFVADPGTGRGRDAVIASLRLRVSL